jgi:hypothetical protein
VKAVLQGVLVAAWSARSARAAMHSATQFPGDRRRLARLARVGFGAATQARQHRPCVTGMIA